MEEQQEARLEWIKFGILTLIMLATVLVIWVVSPLIFDWVVPAIMGEQGDRGSSVFLPASGAEVEPAYPDPEEPISDDAAAADPGTTTPLENDADLETEAYPAPPAGDSTASDPSTADPGTTGTEVDVPTETAGNLLEPQVHVVQEGETLTAIANEYGITIQTLIDLNNLANPNQIQAGAELLLPAEQ